LRTLCRARHRYRALTARKRGLTAQLRTKMLGTIRACLEAMPSTPPKGHSFAMALRERLLLWMWKHGWVSRPL